MKALRDPLHKRAPGEPERRKRPDLLQLPPRERLTRLEPKEVLLASDDALGAGAGLALRVLLVRRLHVPVGEAFHRDLRLIEARRLQHVNLRLDKGAGEVVRLRVLVLEPTQLLRGREIDVGDHAIRIGIVELPSPLDRHLHDAPEHDPGERGDVGRDLRDDIRRLDLLLLIPDVARVLARGLAPHALLAEPLLALHLFLAEETRLGTPPPREHDTRPLPAHPELSIERVVRDEIVPRHVEVVGRRDADTYALGIPVRRDVGDERVVPTKDGDEPPHVDVPTDRRGLHDPPDLRTLLLAAREPEVIPARARASLPADHPVHGLHPLRVHARDLGGLAVRPDDLVSHLEVPDPPPALRRPHGLVDRLRVAEQLRKRGEPLVEARKLLVAQAPKLVDHPREERLEAEPDDLLDAHDLPFDERVRQKLQLLRAPDAREATRRENELARQLVPVRQGWDLALRRDPHRALDEPRVTLRHVPVERVRHHALADRHRLAHRRNVRGVFIIVPEPLPVHAMRLRPPAVVAAPDPRVRAAWTVRTLLALALGPVRVARDALDRALASEEATTKELHAGRRSRHADLSPELVLDQVMDLGEAVGERDAVLLQVDVPARIVLVEVQVLLHLAREPERLT